jgi:hypothetical protein
MKTKECAACGYEDAPVEVEEWGIEVIYGPPIKHEVSFTNCPRCTEKVMCTTREQDRAMEKAIKKSQLASIASMLSFLNEHGITNAQFEWAFRLPKDTTESWLSGAFTASDLALLRLVRTFPELIAVANEGYKRPEPKTLTSSEEKTLALITEDCNGVTQESLVYDGLVKDVDRLEELGYIEARDNRWYAVLK